MRNPSDYEIKKEALVLACKEAEVRVIQGNKIIERAMIYESFLSGTLVVVERDGAEVIEFKKWNEI